MLFSDSSTIWLSIVINIIKYNIAPSQVVDTTFQMELHDQEFPHSVGRSRLESFEPQVVLGREQHSISTLLITIITCPIPYFIIVARSVTLLASATRVV